ncbi:S8 family peptidase [Candidatus Woesearchaeota archaeon]|nr:S8 family peptidase [Candidatus Woesearchaeota archaeon]
MRKAYAIIAMLVLLISMVPLVAAEPPEKVRVFIKIHGNFHAGDGTVLHTYEIVDDVLVVEIPVTAMDALAANPNVIDILPDTQMQALAPPGACTPWPACKDGGDPTDPPEEPPTEPPADPTQVVPWGVDQIDAELSAFDGSGVTVCVVDTGIDRDHPDLTVAEGRNFVPTGRVIKTDRWDDDNGHGTHCAGTVAALDNGLGVVGVAPGATLMAAKVLDRYGSGWTSDIIAGVEWCVANGADIVSMSLGGGDYNPIFEEALLNAEAAGVLVVAAAGNDYGAPVIYPAAYDSVVAVGATDSSNAIAEFSNVGPELELSAPGVAILSTCINGEYCEKSGTSMATPHAAGVAALALSMNSTMAPAEVRTWLQITANDLGEPGWDPIFGYGLVDALLS